MRQDLTALKTFTYAGRVLKAGDPFSASRADGRALLALGRAAPAATYQTTQAVATVTKDTTPATAFKQAPAKKVAAKKAAAK